MDAQIAFDSETSEPRLKGLNDAKVDLHNWLNSESAHWKQKSEIHWLQDGDRNTRFFHLAKSSIHNHIDSIFVGGNIIEEEVPTSFKCSNLPPPPQMIPSLLWTDLLSLLIKTSN